MKTNPWCSAIRKYPSYTVYEGGKSLGTICATGRDQAARHFLPGAYFKGEQKRSFIKFSIYSDGARWVAVEKH